MYLYDAYGVPTFYDPYGNVRTSGSAYDNHYLFKGAAAYQWYQYPTIYYCRARFYEPAHGRWLQPDPIGQAGGLNIYTYCHNDPVKGVDPSGLDKTNVGETTVGTHIPNLTRRNADGSGATYTSAIAAGVGGYGAGSTYYGVPSAGISGLASLKGKKAFIGQTTEPAPEAGPESSEESGNLRSSRMRDPELEREVEKGNDLADLLRAVFSRLRDLIGQNAEAQAEREAEAASIAEARENSSILQKLRVLTEFTFKSDRYNINLDVTPDQLSRALQSAGYTATRVRGGATVLQGSDGSYSIYPARSSNNSPPGASYTVSGAQNPKFKFNLSSP